MHSLWLFSGCQQSYQALPAISSPSHMAGSVKHSHPKDPRVSAAQMLVGDARIFCNFAVLRGTESPLNRSAIIKTGTFCSTWNISEPINEKVSYRRSRGTGTSPDRAFRALTEPPAESEMKGSSTFFGRNEETCLVRVSLVCACGVRNTKQEAKARARRNCTA